MLRAARLCAVYSFVLASAALLPLATANAQDQDRKLSPVTDAMLANPDPGRLADVAAHAEQLGLQPARSDQPRNVAQLQLVWTRAARRRATRKARRSCTTASCTSRIRPTSRRRIDAATGEFIWEYRRDAARRSRRVLPGIAAPTATSRSTTT